MGSENLQPSLQGVNGTQRWRSLGPGVELPSVLGKLFPRFGLVLICRAAIMVSARGCHPGPPPQTHLWPLSAAQVPDSDEQFVPDFHSENCE